MDRFWSKVEVRGPDECWPWKAGTDKKGYGLFWFQGTGGVKAHRVAWHLTYGSFPPPELEIDHTCNFTGCQNVRHMEAVTKTVNTQRRDDRLGNPAARTDHCKHGHPFSGDNLYINKKGHRICRACGRERQKR